MAWLTQAGRAVVANPNSSPEAVRKATAPDAAAVIAKAAKNLKNTAPGRHGDERVNTPRPQPKKSTQKSTYLGSAAL